jgi:hypothetical protein
MDLYVLGKQNAKKKRLLLPLIDEGASIAAGESASDTDRP